MESEATRPEPDAASDPSRNPVPPRRPPMTIDLAANPSGAAAPSAEPESEIDTALDESEPFDDELRPPPLPPRNEAGLSTLTGGLPLMPLALAAGAGALAALVIAFLASTAGIVATPASRDANAALARVEKLETDLAAARAAETRVATEVQAVSARLAGVETMSHDLVTTTEQLRGLDGTAAANEALINQLAGQVSDLRAAVKAMGTADPNAPGGGAAISALTARLDEMSAQLSSLSERPAGAETQTAAAARTMALAGLRSASERGEPFGDTLRLLSMLGVDAALLAPLESVKGGVPSKDALAASFDKVSGDILLASDTAAPDTNLFWRVVHQLGSVVTIRPAGPVAGTTPVAIVSRMRAAVSSGNLEEALRERDGLPDAGKFASEGWARDMRARIALDKAVAALAAAIDTPPPAESEGPPA